MAANDKSRTGSRTDLGEFLTTRRARITPEQAGLPVYAANRRVTGLPREEVALLAGISVELSTRSEDWRHRWAAPPDTPSAEALNLLASWSATGPAAARSDPVAARHDKKD